MIISKDKLLILWYENSEGEKWVPDLTSGDPGGIPEGYDYQYSQFPTELILTILSILPDGSSTELAVGHSGWQEDLVLAMTNSGEYTMSEAILISANTCERCMNALAEKCGLDWGYLEYSDEWKKSNTTCDFCRQDGYWKDGEHITAEEHDRQVETGEWAGRALVNPAPALENITARIKQATIRNKARKKFYRGGSMDVTKLPREIKEKMTLSVLASANVASASDEFLDQAVDLMFKADASKAKTMAEDLIKAAAADWADSVHDIKDVVDKKKLKKRMFNPTAANNSITVGDVTLTLKKDAEWQEWQVEWKEGGKVSDEKSYFSGGEDAESKEDAIATMNAMAQDLKKKTATIGDEGYAVSPYNAQPFNGDSTGDVQEGRKGLFVDGKPFNADWAYETGLIDEEERDCAITKYNEQGKTAGGDWGTEDVFEYDVALDDLRKAYPEGQGLPSDAALLDFLQPYKLSGKDKMDIINEVKAPTGGGLITAAITEDKDATPISGEQKFENNNEIVCPADHKKRIQLFREICQDYQKIPECFHSVCSFYPDMIDNTVTNVDFNPRKIKGSLEGNVFKVEGQEFTVKGATFGEKLRSLRDSLLEKIGIKKTQQVINELAATCKTASVVQPIRKFAGIEIQAGKRYYIACSRHAEGKGMRQGILSEVKEFDDGAILITGKTKKGEFTTKPSYLLKVSELCGNFAEAEGICTINCPKVGILAGNMCPFQGDDQATCPCFLA